MKPSPCSGSAQTGPWSAIRLPPWFEKYPDDSFYKVTWPTLINLFTYLPLCLAGYVGAASDHPTITSLQLARYRTLSPLAGVRVSPICLGEMSIGDKWHEVGLGAMDKESSFKLLDVYFDLGISRHSTGTTASIPYLTLNGVVRDFIDTANN